MRKVACTAGVYALFGTKGDRVGQSKCMETRIPAVAKKYRSCLGEVRKVVTKKIRPKSRRLAVEKKWIDKFLTIHTCNLVRR